MSKKLTFTTFVMICMVTTLVMGFSHFGAAAASMQEGTTPSLTTDKADYAPGEVVTVFGAGFTPDTTYAIPVMRPDGTIVTIDPFTHAITYGWEITEPAGWHSRHVRSPGLSGRLGR